MLGVRLPKGFILDVRVKFVDEGAQNFMLSRVCYIYFSTLLAVSLVREIYIFFHTYNFSDYVSYIFSSEIFSI